MTNNLKAERTLTAEELDTILAIGEHEQSGRVTNYELKELVRVYRLQSLSTQQPMGEVRDEMVERAARAIAGTAYEGVYFTTRTRQQYIDAEWRNHSTDARTALTAAIHPNQESGE